jgi:hypothetical protein
LDARELKSAQRSRQTATLNFEKFFSASRIMKTGFRVRGGIPTRGGVSLIPCNPDTL